MSSPSNTKAFTIAGLAACVIGLSGCSDIYFDRREGIAPWSGNAVAQNKIVQMVDPWPPYANNRNIAFNGEVMQRAQERYREGYVIPPVNATTSSAAYASAKQNAASAQNSVQRNTTPPPPPPAPSTWAGPQKSQAQAQP
jgi:hypothetical protein